MPSLKRKRPRKQRLSNRFNRRNELLKLQLLLRSACRLLDQYGIEFTVDLGRWWGVQRNLELLRKLREAEEMEF